MKKLTRKHLRPFLEQYRTEKQVLDIGGGRVDTNHTYQDLFPDRVTVDIDPERKPDVVGDVHELPFEESSFPYIVCTEVLEHLHSPECAIAEMQRVLKPGGTLILTTRFVYPLHDVPHDYFRFTKYGLQHLFRDWDVVALQPETTTLGTIGALLQRVGFQTDVQGGKFTKAILYSLAWLFDRLSGIVTKEYGDIGKTSSETTVMTTGYYLVAKNKSI